MCQANLETATWVTSAVVAMPPSTRRGGLLAWTIAPSQVRQAYFGKIVRFTRTKAGTTSRASRVSSPIRWSAPAQQGQAVVSGSITSSHRGCVARIRGVGALTPAPASSGNADISWASQVQHAVEHMDRYVHLGGPTLLRERAQLIPDHAFVSADRGLGPGSRRIPRGRLPGPAAPLGDELKMAVPLGGRARGRLARHRGYARRDDDGGLRMALGYVGVNALLVVRAVRRDGGDRVGSVAKLG